MQQTVIIDKRTDLPAPKVFAEPSGLQFQTEDTNIGYPVFDGTLDTDEVYLESGAPQFLDSDTSYFHLFATHGGPIQVGFGDAVTMGRLRNYKTEGGNLSRNFIAGQILATGVAANSNSMTEFSVNSGYTEVGTAHYQFGESVGSKGRTTGTCNLIFESEDLGVEDQDWFLQGMGSTIVPDDTTVTLSFTSPITSVAEEPYIVFWQTGVFFGQPDDAISDRTMQWSMQIDDLDLNSALTGNTTGGASRPGRGWSWSWEEIGRTLRVTGVTVRTLPKGNIDGQIVAHREGDSATLDDRIGTASMFIIRQSMFSQAIIKKVDDEVFTTTSVTFQSTPFEVSITSSDKVLIIFHTSVMAMSLDALPLFRIVNSNDDVIHGAIGFGSTTWNNPYEDLTSPSSDADLLPMTIYAVFDNPGTETFKIQYQRNGAGGGQEVRWNCRDDGTAGFEGYMMALELKIATDT